MKVWRTFIKSLLVVLLATTGSGGIAVAAAARTSSGAQEASAGTKLTAEEEREVREMAERFIRRMQETNDIAPLVGEMFVTDYAERLRQEAIKKPLTLLSRSVVEQSSREELLRYQLALDNSLYVATLLFLAYKTAHPADDDDDEQEWGATFYKQLLPPDIIELCKSDPILKVLLEEETNEGAEESQPGAPLEKPGVIDHDDEPIRTREQLRNFTSTLEQAIALARRHLAAVPHKLALPDRHNGANEEENWSAEREAMKPREWMLTEEFYGYPKGTRVFCVNALIYHMDLIRVDGKLKVLALNFYMD
jgi:hypothetical protein